jgi:hypothetical protein
MGDGGIPDLHLWRGGLLDGLGRAAGLVRGRPGDSLRLAAALVAVAWLPFAVLAVLGRLGAGQWDPLALDVKAHVRWLVTIPLLAAGEWIMDDRVVFTVRYLRESGLVAKPSAAALAHAESETARWCNSWLLEAALLVLAVVPGVSQLALARTPASWWYALVGLPLARFILLRWLQRWLLWTALVARLSRLELTLIGLHPDRAGGLGNLTLPSRALALPFLALGTLVAASLGTRMLAGVAFERNLPAILGYMGLCLAVAVLPLVFFVPALARAKRQALVEYGSLACTYVQGFEERWLRNRAADPLGSADIQSLNDLGGSYAVIDQMRLLPFSPRFVVELAAFALAPMVPLYLASVSIDEVAARLLRIIF